MIAPITVFELRSLMLKQIALAGFVSFTVAAFPVVSKALTVQEVPNSRQVNGGWVTDMAQMLSPATEAQLNQIISDLEAKNSSEIAVVTVPETAPSATPKAFATALFNYWGIGKKGQDNGVLLLISQGDRRVEIETGYGIESILPDARVRNIIQSEIAPRFKQGDFNSGTLAGTQALVVDLRAYQPPVTASVPTAPVSIPAAPASVSTTTASILGVIYPLASVGGVLVLIIGTVAYVRRSRSRILLEPAGRSRIEGDSGDTHPWHCATCKKRMQKLDAIALQPYLSQAEQVAQKLGSIRFEGWQCLKCYPQLTGQTIHICAYILDSQQFSTCLTCQELTVTQTIKAILEQPTWNREGKQLVAKECHCCSYNEEVKEMLPCLTPSRHTVFIEPTGRSRVIGSTRPTHCADCRYPMQQMDWNILQFHLRKPERAAQNLGSVKFIGWQCPNGCQQTSSSGIHIRAYILNSRQFSTCPTCHELTVQCTSQVSRSATEYSQGIRLFTHNCHCCSYQRQIETKIPRLPPRPSSTQRNSVRRSSTSWISNISSTSSSDTSSYSSSDTSSSSSDFGGGSSGGGGGGGDW
ncbi:MAG: TPM domain-containing protein [Cyanobacteriota bacterium]